MGDLDDPDQNTEATWGVIVDCLNEEGSILSEKPGTHHIFSGL